MARIKKLFKITGSKSGKQFADIVNLSNHTEVFYHFQWDAFCDWDDNGPVSFEGGAVNGKETVQMIITDTGEYEDDENMKRYRVHICNGLNKPIEFEMLWMSTLGYATFKIFYVSGCGPYPLEFDIYLNRTSDKPSPKAAACHVFERMLNTAFHVSSEVVNKNLLTRVR